MNFLNKTIIHGGHKNKTYKVEENNELFFLKIKQFDDFNHKVDYKKISRLNFVPKLIEDNEEYIVWEFIENTPFLLDKKNIENMAMILYKLHNSNVTLPPSNHEARVRQYFDIVQKKKNIPKEINTFHKKALSIIKGFDCNTPLHNDPWVNNFIKHKNSIFLIDWEYASLGDKHFDLAFAIDGSYFDLKQEAIFLEAYGEYDKQKLLQAKTLVNYLTLVWMHGLEKLPFDDKIIIQNLYK